MIIRDTNVLSEALKPAPDAVVLQWLALQPVEEVFTTSVTQAEVLYGVEVLPAGKRRSQLAAAVEALFSEEFAGRILPFDEEAASVYAQIVVGRDAIGRPISQFDAVIASVCRSRGASLATRNVSDFERCGVSIINPWNFSA